MLKTLNQCFPKAALGENIHIIISFGMQHLGTFDFEENMCKANLKFSLNSTNLRNDTHLYSIGR